MKIKSILLALSILGISCAYILNRNSIKVETDNVDAYKYDGIQLRTNHYVNTKDCFDNLSNYEDQSDEYITKNGKIYKSKKAESNFILTCDFDGQMYLRLIRTDVDFETVKELGQFWIDKNNVYGNYQTSDGDMLFKIKEADVKTFQNLGNSIYGKDHKFLYDMRHGKLNIVGVDKKTFRPIYRKGQSSTAYGRDKNNYFFWDEIIEDTTRAFKQQFEIK